MVLPHIDRGIPVEQDGQHTGGAHEPRRGACGDPGVLSFDPPDTDAGDQGFGGDVHPHGRGVHAEDLRQFRAGGACRFRGQDDNVHEGVDGELFGGPWVGLLTLRASLFDGVDERGSTPAG